MALSRTEREQFLAEPHVAALAVNAGEKGDRAPLAVPIWYQYVPGGDIWIMTGRDSRKADLIRAAGRFTLGRPPGAHDPVCIGRGTSHLHHSRHARAAGGNLRPLPAGGEGRGLRRLRLEGTRGAARDPHAPAAVGEFGPRQHLRTPVPGALVIARMGTLGRGSRVCALL